MKQLRLMASETEAFPVELKSAKRTRRERSSIHAWHSYYAGYSEAFVDSAIEYLGLGSRSLIVDPWCGSGTSNAVAARSGVSSIGLDINPAMAMFAASKSPAAIQSDQHIEDLIRIFGQIKCTQEFDDDPVHEVLSPSLAGCARGMAASIEEQAKSYREEPHVSSLYKKFEALSPIRSFLYAVLFVTVRRLSGFQKASNPTWFKSMETKPTCTKSRFCKEYQASFASMLSDVKKFYGQNSEDVPCRSLVGDSRNMPLRTNSCDAVITSPPYLTRIDYAISTKLELLLLQSTEDSLVRSVRDQSMGATVIRKTPIDDEKGWGSISLSILDEVRDHQTKAAKSYYLKNMRQYFYDAFESLKEISRIVRTNGKALLVVQSSYFKEVEIPLGDIYVEMASSLGLKASIAFREPVRGHMAHVNTKSSGYIKDKVYFEDVVEVTCK